MGGVPCRSAAATCVSTITNASGGLTQQMKFEPETFFIGIIDFFSILLPGAVVTAVVTPEAKSVLFGPVFPAYAGEAEQWAIFLFASYLLGHFFFFLGSRLDEWVYERIRDATPEGEQVRMVRGEKPAWRLTKRLARDLFGKCPDLAVRQVYGIKEGYLPSVEGKPVVNAFQWSKARLTIQCPAALAEVQRLEADSKFFRTMVVVLVLVAAWVSVRAFWAPSAWGVVLMCLALACLSLLRYVERRFKATQHAYWYLLTLEHCPPGGEKKQEARHPTHAGGVVYRQEGNQWEYLLVQATKRPQEWVLPKGHIEAGEHMQETATREVREEAGVEACIKDDLGLTSFSANRKRIDVQFYLMEAVKEVAPMDRGRKHLWLPLVSAIAQATHKESRALLNLADRRRSMRTTVAE